MNDMSKGRKKLDELVKAKRAASRAYAKIQSISEKTKFDLLENRVQFHESEKTMGRPPVPLPVQKQRAEAEFRKLVDLVHKIEEERGLPLSSESSIAFFDIDPASEKVGRKKVDAELNKIIKYIKRTEQLIEKIREEKEEEIEEKTLGRKRMSKQQKIVMYEERIKQAQESLQQMEGTKSKAQLELLKLNEIRAEVRQLRILINNPDSFQVVNMSLSQEEAQQRLSVLDKQEEEQLRIYSQAESEEAKSGRFEQLRSDSKIAELARLQKLEDDKKNRLEALKKEISEIVKTRDEIEQELFSNKAV
jgi:hypothetical protein